MLQATYLSTVYFHTNDETIAGNIVEVLKWTQIRQQTDGRRKGHTIWQFRMIQPIYIYIYKTYILVEYIGLLT